MLKSLLLVVVILAAGILPGCAREKEVTTLLVLHAGSLVIPFEQVEKEYEALHPEIDLRFEGHGSIQVVRHTTEIGDPASVAVVADYSLLPLLMYPARLPDGSGPYADWHIRFATNRLGIAYTDDGAYADEMTDTNWYEILQRDDVNLGLSDPRLDAVGYRSLMLIQLAENYYRENNLFEDLITRNFTPSVPSFEDAEGIYQIRVPELLQANKDRIYLRGFSVQLLSLLEARQIDYAFEYESVARQHDLNWLPLPREVDLSLESMADIYAGVQVTLDYHRYATVNPVFEGLPIVYGVTIPRSAPHPAEAAAFLDWLLGPEGRRILQENDQPPLEPLETDNPDAVPELLRHLFAGSG
jgi:molybdate/tungstate transport system substrate-binding protein